MSSSIPVDLFPLLPPGESRASQIIPVIITFGVLSTIAVILRLYTRIKILKIFDVDDGLMVFAQILVIGIVIIICLAVKYGLGTHILTQSYPDLTSSLSLLYTTVIVYLVALSAVKLSILFQIRGIFNGKRMQFVTLIGIIFIILWTISAVFLAAFVCRPVRSAWDIRFKASCLNLQSVYYTMAGINIVTDFAIFTMPLPVIKTLRLPMKEKIILFFIFSLGFFTCCVSIIRLRTIQSTSDTQDPTWDDAPVVTWSFIEPATAVITACLAALRPLVVKLLPRFFVSKSENNSNQRPNADFPESVNTDLHSSEDLEK